MTSGPISRSPNKPNQIEPSKLDQLPITWPLPPMKNFTQPLNRVRVRSIIRTLSTLLFSVSSALLAVAERPPNIIYILADDLGYGDPSCYGQTAFETPHIDRLAAEGMRFTRHYSGATVCAPSRSAFLEGRHGGHCSVRGNQPPHLTPADVTTLPMALKPAGYTSAVIGKWGVGHFPQPDDPMRCGFDHAFGYVNMWHAHNCFPEFLYRDGVRIELEGNRLDPDHPFDHLPEGTGVAADRAVFAPDLIEAEALAFIETNRNGPFFLYLALNLPHTNGEAARALGDGNEVPDYGSIRRSRRLDGTGQGIRPHGPGCG